jgi:DNA repair protein RadC
MHGFDNFADYELLEMLLSFAIPRRDTKALAKTLIDRFGSYAGVLAASWKGLLYVEGLGPVAVCQIKLVDASVTRKTRPPALKRPILDEWDKLIEYLNVILAREKVEHFRVLFLDTRNRLISDEELAKGTVNGAFVYTREVVNRALELHATGIVLVHNHPSGDPEPSPEDIKVTLDLQKAGAIFSVILHDHIIIGDGRYVSFRERGLLK